MRLVSPASLSLRWHRPQQFCGAAEMAGVRAAPHKMISAPRHTTECATVPSSSIESISSSFMPPRNRTRAHAPMLVLPPRTPHMVLLNTLTPPTGRPPHHSLFCHSHYHSRCSRTIATRCVRGVGTDQNVHLFHHHSHLRGRQRNQRHQRQANNSCQGGLPHGC